MDKMAAPSKKPGASASRVLAQRKAPVAATVPRHRVLHSANAPAQLSLLLRPATR